MNVDQFEKEMASAQRRPFYCIFGGDPSAVRRAVEAARRVVAPAYRSLNYRQFAWDELGKGGMERVVLEAAANPFGEPPRVALVRFSEDEKVTAEALEPLVKMLKKPNPSSTVVLAFSGAPDARFKLFKDAVKTGCDVDCRVPDKRDLPAWLEDRFAERGATLTSEGAKAIIERMGDNLGALLGEADKLSLWPGGQTRLGPAQVRELVSLGPTAEIYELGQPLGAGRLDEALPTLLDLLEKNNARPLLWAVGTHFRRLLRLKAMLDASQGRVGNGELASEMGVQVFAVNRLRAQAERWSWARLKKALAAIGETHRLLVTSPVGDAMALQALAAKLGSLALEA
ncbi:MAG: DNA polymerase III subunit delta [Deltaproteobacteria bacterium]|jgi:DNA polymerase-3 subunit delta|nr:DNA polymerase III subunit delta [Deltaproteobacteria bacterium]